MLREIPHKRGDPEYVPSRCHHIGTVEDPKTHRWNPFARLGFRFAFCYGMTYCLCNGNVGLWIAIPVAGQYIHASLA